MKRTEDNMIKYIAYPEPNMCTGDGDPFENRDEAIAFAIENGYFEVEELDWNDINSYEDGGPADNWKVIYRRKEVK